MQAWVDLKIYSVFITVGIVMALSCCSTLVHASGLAEIFQQKQVQPSDSQWPVVVNGSNEILGKYGGISSAYNQVGAQESAILVILKSGYIVPVLGDGEIATFPLVYFSGENCEGREYYPVSAPLSGALPVRGMIYRSVLSKTLVYIPRHEESSEILAGSRLILDQNGNTECEKTSDSLRALAATTNSPEITGVYDDDVFDLVSVGAGGSRNEAQAKEGTAGRKLFGSSEKPDYSGDADPVQEECSPGCLFNAVGNGSCDAECYVQACSFDRGDCAALDPAELQKMMSDMCSPGCFSADIGDSFCDTACNNQACQYDGGDCKR